MKSYISSILGILGFCCAIFVSTPILPPGPIGDGIADDTAAIQKMIDDSVSIKLKAGTYKCSAPLENKGRTVRIEGEGTATLLMFPQDTTAFVITRKPDGSGDRSILRSLYFKCKKVGTDNTAHGIIIGAGRVLLDDVTIDKFSGNGIEISGSNLWNINRCATRWNGGDGLHLSGSDVNVGIATQLDSLGNAGWGIREEGVTLGSSYLSCHVANNTLGGYSIGGLNSYSVLLGSYSESGQPKSKLGQRTISLGGDQGAGFDTTGFPGSHIATDWLGLQIPRCQNLTLHGGVTIKAGSAPPTNGSWIRGARILNQNPSVNQPEGWICTVSGSPGTWKACARIQP